MWISGACCSNILFLYCIVWKWRLCMMPFSDSGEVSVLSKACSGRKYRCRIFVFLLQICHCVSYVSHRGKTNIFYLTIQFIYISLSFFIYDTCHSKHYYSSYVTLDHKTSLKSLGYIYSNSQKYIVWVKMIDFSFMPKIIRTLSKDHVPWRYFVNFIL